MQRLDRYFFFALLVTTLAGVAFALIMLLSLQSLRLGDLIIKTGGDLSIISKMFEGLSLSLTPIILPIAFVFGSLAVFGRMSSDRELIALQGMGYSPWRLMRPGFLASTILSLLTIACSLYIAPYGNRLFEKGIDEAISKKGASALRPGTFTEDFADLVMYVGERAGENRFKKIFIYDGGVNFKREGVISAKEAQWNPAGPNGWAKMQLFNGTMVSKNLDEKVIWRINFEEYQINMDFRYAEGKSRDSTESQDLQDLIAKRNKVYPKQEDQRWLWIEFARRIWVSISFFFFLPFCFISSLRNQRTAQSRVILTGVLLAMAYWGVYFSLISFTAKNPAQWLHHEALVWFIVAIPNLLVGALSLVLIKKRFGKVFIH